MMPPNLLVYWVARRRSGVPLSEEELTQERFEIQQMQDMLDSMPRLALSGIAGGFVLSILLVFLTGALGCYGGG